MAYTPVEFTNGTRTEVAYSIDEETQLRWDGWVPTGSYVPPADPASYVTHAELTAAMVGIARTLIHGSNASVARPVTTSPVVWYGTVSPINLADGDVYVPVTAGS